MKRLTLILSLLMATAIHAQSLHWDTAGVDLGAEATLTIGDQLNLVLQADHYPSPQELSQNDILLLSQCYDTAAGQMVYVATCFEEGEHRLGLGADSILLIVNDVPNVDTSKADIKDIANIMKEPLTFWEIFRWVLLVLGVALIAWGAVFVSRKVKKREPLITLPKAPPLPPDTVALNDLETLRQKELWQHGRAKEYHTELTDILRRYLCDQFGIDSLEMTSDQTLDAYESLRPQRDESHEMLRTVLRTADMVKFAKAEPQPHEHELSLKNARTFVETTRPASTEDKQ